jgi:lysophospholipase L1-like esterase
MGEKAGLGSWGRLSKVSLVCSLALLGGCLPQGGDDGDSSKASAFGFAGGGTGEVNRSDKGDAVFGNVAAIADKLLHPSGQGEQPERRTAALSEAPAISSSTDTASPAAVEINDTPANVALANFYSALGKLEGGRGEGAVTVLHLGDSHIAADRFSGDMREQFQSRFGNAGRGMLMPGLYLARGVKFEQGGQWQAALSTGSAPGPYGVTGVKVSAGAREDWLRMTATDRPFGWTEVTLQTGPDHGNALIALDGEIKQIPTNASTPSWKTVRLEKPSREILIRPKGDGAITVHGIAIGEDKAGVRYVNLGLPGATAVTPLAWNPAQLAYDLKRLSPDLIVVGYGTEESFDDALNMRDYEAKAVRMLGLLRQAAPDASLLVIGPPDVARLPNFAGATGRASDVCRALSPQERASYAQRLRASDPRLARWHPPLRLDEVRSALRRAAAASQAYFWDWSKLMGGACGVHAWVHSDPPLAANDHIHLTEEGSKRSARLLFRELMTGYDAFTRPAPTAAAVTPVVAPAPPLTGWKATATPTAPRKGKGETHR